jgi:two-component system alkaline phosphatase synthesis response regulator PhoP
MHSARILIIEDDIDVRALLRKHLLDAGCEVDEAEDGEIGSQKAVQERYDLLILDLNLPKIDGLEVCRIVRAHDSLIPILMLTAKREEIDRVLGLELGADDYLTKPFSIRELLARIKAILRRAGVQKEREEHTISSTDESFLTFGALTIDIGRRKVLRDELTISLSNMEFELLLYLAERPGRPFSREQILEEVWGYSAIEYAQNISTHVNRLRKKIEPNPEEPIYVKTVRGFGYAFAEPSDFEHENG